MAVRGKHAARRTTTRSQLRMLQRRNQRERECGNNNGGETGCVQAAERCSETDHNKQEDSSNSAKDVVKVKI